MSTPRDKLLLDAAELGIKVNARWGDDRLQKEIDKALADSGQQPSLLQGAEPIELPDLAVGDKLINLLENRLDIFGTEIEPLGELVLTEDHVKSPAFVKCAGHAVVAQTLKLG